MVKICPRCETESTGRNLFCECGAAFSTEDLKRVRIMGAVGVAHSSSPTIEKFWATGDPSVFD